MADGSAPVLTRHYYRIGEVAKLAGVTTTTLRWWETEFSSIVVTRSGKGQRVYSRRVVELVLRIRHLLHVEGYTTAGARRRLKIAESCPHCGKPIGEKDDD